MATIVTNAGSLILNGSSSVPKGQYTCKIESGQVRLRYEDTDWKLDADTTVDGASSADLEALLATLSAFSKGGTGPGTGVQSVTGDGVGGTATDPILSFPTPAQIGAATTAQVNDRVAKAGDTMSGPLNVIDTVNRSKVVLGKYTSGSGHNNAPTAFDKTSVYLHLGALEYNTNSYRLIGFGYRRSADQSHTAAVVGYQETNSSTDDCGRLLFATRPTPTDVAPTIRLTIEPTGEIEAKAGAKFVGDGSGLTGVTASRGTVLAVTGNKTLALTDEFAYQRATATATITIPTNASVAFSIGASIDFFQASAGAITFAPASGVIINSYGDVLSTDGKGAAATLKKVGTNEWDLII